MQNVPDGVHAFLPYDPVDVRSADDGPLSGLSLAVKDIFDVAGYPTGCGNPIKTKESPIYAESAPIVQQLLDAGARFVGKTQTDELAFSLNGQNMHYPEAINSRAPGRITGGSSSGSAAAVAAGLADIAIGSDTGGSVRAPASFCGLFGIRPTHGRVTLEGVMPLASSFDVPGYFTDDPDVFGRVAPVFLGEDKQRFPLNRPVRIAEAFDNIMPAGEADAIADAEMIAERILGHGETRRVTEAGLAPWLEIFRILQSREAWEAHGAWIESRDPEMTPGVRDRFEFGASVSPAMEQRARDQRQEIRDGLAEILANDGVFVLPTMPSTAPLSTIDGEDLRIFRERSLSPLCMAGLSGLPQVSIPLATHQGFPMGLSLIGPHGSDVALIDLAVRVYRER